MNFYNNECVNILNKDNYYFRENSTRSLMIISQPKVSAIRKNDHVYRKLIAYS